MEKIDKDGVMMKTENVCKAELVTNNHSDFVQRIIKVMWDVSCLYEASMHQIDCKCHSCELWWFTVGPDWSGEFGPFGKSLDTLWKASKIYPGVNLKTRVEICWSKKVCLSNNNWDGFVLNVTYLDLLDHSIGLTCNYQENIDTLFVYRSNQDE